MSDTQRKVILIVLSLFLVGLGIYGLINFFSRGSGDESSLVDKYTGESINLSEEAQEDTGGGGESYSKVILFGLADTIKKVRESDNQTTGSFIDSVRKGLWNYSRERTNDEFATITIIPGDMKVNGNVITSNIRLGQDEGKAASIKIELSKDRQAAIITIDEDSTLSEYKGKYIYVGGLESDSPLFTIQQKNDTSTDLTVDAVEGNRESALNHLVATGYYVSDFTIEFTNYERPTL